MASGGGGGDLLLTMPEGGARSEPLGTEDNIFWFLTSLGELRGLAADKVANKHIVGMFVPKAKYLYETWPRRKEVALKISAASWRRDPEDNALKAEWITVGWRADDVAVMLCAQAGRIARRVVIA